MTLHEAIVKLLQETGRPMSTREIADALNKNKWYQKKDGSSIDAFQIHGRTKNYSHLFDKDGSIVSLKNQKGQVVDKTIRVYKTAKKLSERNFDLNALQGLLMNEKSFKSAGEIDYIVPNFPGLYCIRIKEIQKLPKPFDSILSERNHNIIYIGIASGSLQKRFLNQELRAKGHGTFFRSIGAVLGFAPPKGSLVNKSNKRNYAFSKEDESKIIDWINNNLVVNWVEFEGDFESVEYSLIKQYLPLINLAKNPAALPILSDLRAKCVKVANEI